MGASLMFATSSASCVMLLGASASGRQIILLHLRAFDASSAARERSSGTLSSFACCSRHQTPRTEWWCLASRTSPFTRPLRRLRCLTSGIYICSCLARVATSAIYIAHERTLASVFGTSHGTSHALPLLSVTGVYRA